MPRKLELSDLLVFIPFGNGLIVHDKKPSGQNRAQLLPYIGMHNYIKITLCVNYMSRCLFRTPGVFMRLKFGDRLPDIVNTE